MGNTSRGGELIRNNLGLLGVLTDQVEDTELYEKCCSAFCRITMSGDDDPECEEVAQRFRELCLAVNMDKPTMELAWNAYENTKMNYTLEGDALHWLVCSLYAACRRNLPTIQTVSGQVVTSNYVSLTKLLHEAKFSFISFLKKMGKWIEMKGTNDALADHVATLGRSFEVSTNVFKKYMGIFKFVFCDPDDPKYHTATSSNSKPQRPHRNRRHRKSLCTPHDVFKFCWILFVHSKGTKCHDMSDELVGSFQLLLSVIDQCYRSALYCEHRASLLNSKFPGLPEGWDESDFKPSNETCHDIITLLVKEKAALGLTEEETEQFLIQTRVVNVHNWKKYIKSLVDDDSPVMVTDEDSLLLPSNFQKNYKELNKCYEEYVLTEGDFDERVFLCDDVDTELGTPIKSPPQYNSSAHHRREVAAHLAESGANPPQTPLTNHEYLERNREGTIDGSLTPVSIAVQSAAKLRNILQGKKEKPSARLSAIFSECSEDPTQTIKDRLSQLCSKFESEYTKPMGNMPGSPEEFAKARSSMAVSLYYHVLEGTMLREKKRLNGKADLTELLKRDDFHTLLFACCIEIVLHSNQCRQVFPWLLDALDITPYYFYKVFELVIRAEERLPDACIKHLIQIEEQILEKLAWKTGSPLWTALTEANNVGPQCEEVNHSQYIESKNAIPGTVSLGTAQSSPVAHPRVKAVAESEVGGRSKSEGRAARDLFSSPMPGSAKRQLFPVKVTNPPPSKSLLFQPVSPDKGRRVIPVCSIKVAGQPIEQVDSPKPKRGGSLALFFRKVYHLAGVRLRHLCENLAISAELRSKMWTCFEHSISQKCYDLMRDRHIDQLIMCAVYVMAKITQHDQSFQEIMRCYRSQPQALSNVYRSVLIHRASSPTPSQSVPQNMRSASTLPKSSTPPASPVTATQEVRGDLIHFYNQVYLPLMKDFVRQFGSSGDARQLEVPISPMPLSRTMLQSPRKVSGNHNIYVSPLRSRPNLSAVGASVMEYNFQRSPAKQLRDINSMMKRHTPSMNNKRHLAFGEAEDSVIETKRPVSRRLQLVQDQRNGLQ